MTLLKRHRTRRDIFLAVNGEASHAWGIPVSHCLQNVYSGGLYEISALVNADRGFRLSKRRERHLRWYALLTVSFERRVASLVTTRRRSRLGRSRGGVTTAPIPRRVIAFRLVERDALSPRVNPSCDIRGSVDIGLKCRNVAVVVRTPELSL